MKTVGFCNIFITDMNSACKNTLVSVYFVTSPLHESRLNWIHDPHLLQTSSVPTSQPPASTTNHPVPRIIDSVPRNIYQPPSRPGIVPTSAPIVPSSDVRVRPPYARRKFSVAQLNIAFVAGTLSPSAQE